jgi:NDP-sugar pyrophosphorylase family protein
MQAIILAGGKGVRLKPYTTSFPKSLVPVGDYPILEIIIRQLKKYGFDTVTLAVGHLASLIQAYFDTGKKWGIDISYSFEDKPLGTAGPLKQIKNTEENFLVLNSDDLTDLNYFDFFRNHVKNKNKITISRFVKKVKIDFGVIQDGENNTIKDYIEKPEYTFGVSMGIYAFNREVLDYIPEDSYFDFPHLIKALIKQNIPVHFHDHDGFWLDIGRPEDYETATAQFDELKTKIL